MVVVPIRREHLDSPILSREINDTPPFKATDRLMISGAELIRETNYVKSNILFERGNSPQNVTCPVFLSKYYDEFRNLVIRRYI